MVSSSPVEETLHARLRQLEDVVRSCELQANASPTKPVDPAESLEVVQSFQQFRLSAVRPPTREGE